MRPPELERYEILEELGQGGMSVVYRARDKQLSRDVAVKVLHTYLAKQSEARHRFHREAVAVAKLRHPGILEIFDYSGPEALDAYIVTELLPGGTLRDFVDARGGRIKEPELAVLLVHEIARALEHAHAQGVIHRDIKPENVMFAGGGVLKLMDFGIAQVRDGQRLTATGTLLGSPAHMAPEVIDGRRPDERSDLFSLGTVLYWLATGQMPFEAANPSALFKQILDGRYDDPQMVEPKVGNGLARIIRKLLAVDPAERYQSAHELLDVLHEELARIGLIPEQTECQRYLANPDTYASDLRVQLIDRLSTLGKRALSEHQVGRAIDDFNRVLARDPEHPEVRTLVAKITHRKDLRRRLRQSAVALGGLALVAATAYAVKERPEPAPPAPAVAVRAAAEPQTGPGRVDPKPPAKDPIGGGGDDPAKAVPKPLPIRPRLAKTKVEPAKTQPILETAPEAVRSADAGIDPADAVVEAKLRIVIGGSFANIELTDLDHGTRRAWTEVVEQRLVLAPGRFELQVAKPGYGRFRPRRLEVSKDGQIRERLPGGGIKSLPSTLRLKVPEPGKPSTDPDWTPDAS